MPQPTKGITVNDVYAFLAFSMPIAELFAARTETTKDDTICRLVRAVLASPEIKHEVENLIKEDVAKHGKPE